MPQAGPLIDGLLADDPIAGAAGDRLHRAGFADGIAAQLVNSPKGRSSVVGIVGRWGSGKSSMLNMVIEAAKRRDPELLEIRFNPGMLSSADELVSRFLVDLAAQIQEQSDQPERARMKGRLKSIGNGIVDYGASLEPLGWLPGGAWLARIGKAGKYIQERRAKMRDNSLNKSHDALAEELSGLDSKIVVVVDDTDRIEPEHVRELLRMIKIVAGFPNVIYLLAYDREYVERAVSRDPNVSTEDGRAYLEKIVQAVHDVPPIDAAVLVEDFAAGLERALKGIDHAPFDEDGWNGVFFQGFRPMFKSMRDIPRYLNSIPATVSALGKDVALVDVLGLEALRVFAPDAWALLPDRVEALTGSGLSLNKNAQNEADAIVVRQIIEASGQHGEAVENLLGQLFPRVPGLLRGHGHWADSTTLMSGRVANRDNLMTYLHRFVGADIFTASNLTTVFQSLTDPQGLAEIVSHLGSGEFEELLIHLSAARADLTPDMAEPASEVFLNNIDKLREGSQGIFDFGAMMHLERFILRLFQAVPNENDRLAIVNRVLPKLTTISARKELLDVVGSEKNLGHELLPGGSDHELYLDLVDQLATTSIEDLLNERELARLFLLAYHKDPTRAPSILEAATRDTRVFAHILRSAHADQSGLELPTGRQTARATLPWKTLVGWFGEDGIKAHIAAAKQIEDELPELTRRAVDTAEKITTGEIKLDAHGWVEDDD